MLLQIVSFLAFVCVFVCLLFYIRHSLCRAHIISTSLYNAIARKRYTLLCEFEWKHHWICPWPKSYQSAPLCVGWVWCAWFSLEPVQVADTAHFFCWRCQKWFTWYFVLFLQRWFLFERMEKLISFLFLSWVDRVVGKLNKGKTFDSLPFDTDHKQSNVVSLRFVAHNACIESAVFPWAWNSGCHPLSRIVLVNSEMFRFFAGNDEKSFRKKNLRALKRLQQADFREAFIPPVHFVLADFARILFILVHNVNLSAFILLLCKYVVALFRAPHFLLVTIRN